MIKRIVKLKIKEEYISDFVILFNQIKPEIIKFQGCLSVELLNDIHTKTIFFTYSLWETEHDLNYYRNSKYFNSVWKEVKLLFSEKAMAWSVEEIL